jgi:hypothetical protein
MTVTAGIDFGLTHVKAHLVTASGDSVLISTMDGRDRRALAAALKDAFGVAELSAAGNGPTDGFEEFVHRRLRGDPLTIEIRTQADGARFLMEAAGLAPPDRHHVVSVGTGVSYALRGADGAVSPLLGSAFGAGAVDGLLAAAGIASGPRIDVLLADTDDGASFDLQLGEAVPALNGTPYGAYVAAHFLKAARNPTADQETFDRLFVSSAVNALVIDVARSLLLHDLNPRCRLVPDAPVDDVIILGTLPSRSRVVRRRLDAALRMIGKRPIFPPDAEYALAVGAYRASSP